MNKKIRIERGHALPLGVTKLSTGVQFAVYLPDCKDCCLMLYRRGYRKAAMKIALSEEHKIGSVYSVVLCFQEEKDGDVASYLEQEFEYTYLVDGKEFADPYSTVLHGREHWGNIENFVARKKVRSGISLSSYEWEGDLPPRTKYEDTILYQLHVRGFTKHASSKVEHKGTFRGVMEKIPYLKELGITALLLFPCYEFNEVTSVTFQNTEVTQENLVLEGPDAQEKIKKVMEKDALMHLNYWGYGTRENYYFAPKASYAQDSENPCKEFCDMVKALHKEGIEVLLDIYFAPGTNMYLMTDCLRSWVLNYHVDGFRVNQEVMPSIAEVSDPVLSGVKLLNEYWDTGMLKNAGVLRKENALAEYNEGFMNDARRYLKSDEGMVKAFVDRFKRNPAEYSVINFMAHVNGFTMKDMVSYDIKHNESNGESNHDGTEYNYSWNCGIEGKTRKRTVQKRRQQQLRNAFVMLFLSQGTPMLLAGDEFGNTQYGNNNAYCHDDSVSWVVWNMTKAEEEQLAYVKKLIAFRKEHPVLHQRNELMGMDTLSCGLPDFSVHGTRAWMADYSNYNRMLGILLCGEYAKKVDGTSDRSVYIIYNMYWEDKVFDLPILPGHKNWKLVLETKTAEIIDFWKEPKKAKKEDLERLLRKADVPARSIAVFLSE